MRLTIKPTKFRDDQILVQVRVGGGQLDLPGDRPTAEWAAASAFPEGGLDQLSAEDIDAGAARQDRRARLRGRRRRLRAVRRDPAGRPGDPDAAAGRLRRPSRLAAGGVRADARRGADHGLDQLDATPGGVLSRDLGRLLHSGDRRWGLPDRGRDRRRDPGRAEGLLQPALSKGPIEVVVVGDITVDKAIEAVGRRPSAPCPPRRAATAAARASTISFPAPNAAPVVLTHKGRADQAIGLIAWPTDDFLSDTQRARKLAILGEVLQLRLTDQLRKAEGVTYSPSAGVLRLAGLSALRLPVGAGGDSAGQARRLLHRRRAITADLRDKPRQPGRAGAGQEAGHRRPGAPASDQRVLARTPWPAPRPIRGALTAIRTSVAQLERVTADDVRQAAQTYLVDAKAWKLEVKPQPVVQASN